LITGKDIAPPVDPVTWYNSIQMWVALILALLSGAALYMKFKRSDLRTLYRRLGLAVLIALVAALLICLGMKIDAWQYALLMFASCFTVTASILYATTVQKGAFKKRGAAITHLGFGLMIVGVLLSGY